ncbi:cysteine--tRNA ligase [bacterium]|nr:MAG: cysteine--tRNA ligase [bacterium]
MVIYNTLTRKKEEFQPVEDGKVKIYFCGMTLQESPHVGHMRAFIFADVMRRYFEYKGYEVTYIQNFTDIDDKVIEKSREEGRDYRVITQEFEREYMEVSDALNIKRPLLFPRATQHIKEIIELIQKLEQKGFAYAVGGDVYFRVRAFKDYGKLSWRNIDELISGARVEVDPKKKDPLDFALWKSAKEGEPYWESPWGKGRPGWHIECSAMSMHYLGETFDIHGGGNDLIFPHHENEIAQSEAATGKTFARYWVHNAMVNIKGDKMSKSLKNFVPVKELLQKYEPDVIRYFLVSSHYRSPIDYSGELLEQAKSSYERIRNFLERGEEEEPLKEDLSEFEHAMDDDFNTSRALAAVFDMIRKGNTEPSLEPRMRGAVRRAMEILGFRLKRKKLEGKEFIEILVDVRSELRKRKEWELADLIRERLKEKGVVLEDTKEGTHWRIE